MTEHKQRGWGFGFHGPSAFVGGIAAIVWAGSASPWLLLLLPFMLIETPWTALVWRWNGEEPRHD